ncbi:hypothetical protein B7760_02829 [Burkholderia glumae]|nr:hypothetical protein B7760_02829 [Burkholderia glumae]
MSPGSFGQVLDIFKWSVRGSHAADLIAGSAAKYASPGVRSAKLEWDRFRLYRSMYSPMGTQGMADRLVRFPLDLFVRDAAPNPLDEHVIAPASLPSIGSPMPGPARPGERARRELAALAGVHDVGQHVTGERFLQCVNGMHGFQRDGAPMREHLLAQSTAAGRYTKPLAIGLYAVSSAHAWLARSIFRQRSRYGQILCCALRRPVLVCNTAPPRPCASSTCARDGAPLHGLSGATGAQASVRRQTETPCTVRRCGASATVQPR